MVVSLPLAVLLLTFEGLVEDLFGVDEVGPEKLGNAPTVLEIEELLESPPVFPWGGDCSFELVPIKEAIEADLSMACLTAGGGPVLLAIQGGGALVDFVLPISSLAGLPASLFLNLVGGGKFPPNLVGGAMSAKAQILAE